MSARTSHAKPHPRGARGTVLSIRRWAAGSALCCLAACGGSGPPEGDDPVEGALAEVTAGTLKAHVEALAHDSMRGRDTGDPGFEMARDYVAAQMRRMGLQPPWDGSYVQPFGLLEQVRDLGSTISIDGNSAAPPDVRVSPDWRGNTPSVSGPGVYVGNALAAGEQEDLSLDGAVALVLAGAPPGLADDPEVAMRERAEVELALSAGATAVVVLDTLSTPDGWLQANNPRRPTRVLADGSTPTPRPDAVVGPTLARRLLTEWAETEGRAGGANLEPGTSVGAVVIRRNHELRPGRSWNVGGIVPGEDGERGAEVVVFTAHLDHVGVGAPDAQGDSIYNGAHDNALGVAKVLAAAEALSMLEPRRSILFLAVGAEESGLLGSLHYLQDPAFALESTVAAINHDGGLMGGRHDDVLAWGPSFSTVEADVEWAANATGITYSRERKPPFTPAAGLLHRSDHTPFLTAGIPSVYLMPGFSRGGDPAAGQAAWNAYLATTHHRQADNPDPSATYESAVALTAMSVRLAWRLAQADGMPSTHPDAPFAKSRQAPNGRFYNP